MKAQNVFNHFLEFTDTSKQKDTLADAAARGRIIALLFHSFESFSKRSHLFQNE